MRSGATMRLRLALTAVLLTTLLLPSCGGVGPVQHDFCDLARDGEMADGELVQMRAIGIFSDHGAVLTAKACPEEFVGWEETREFRSSAGAAELLNTIFDVRNDPMHPHSIELTVVGRLSWRAEGTRPRAMINVRQVDEIRLVEELPHPREENP